MTVDGFDVPVVHARPDGMPRAGVVLHPDIGGLRPLFEDMARRLATHGFAVCAFEPFAARPESELRDRSSSASAHVKELDDAQQLEMLLERGRPARRRRRRLPRLACSASAWAGTTCSRRRRPIASTPRSPSTACCARPTAGRARATRSSRSRSPTEMCPTLAIFGTVDPWTPAADIDALRSGVAGPDATARSSSSKAPSTASCTTPNAPCTAPTTRPTLLGPSDRLDGVIGVELSASRSRELRARRGRGCGTAAAGDLEPAELHEQRDRLVHALA